MARAANWWVPPPADEIRPVSLAAALPAPGWPPHPTGCCPFPASEHPAHLVVSRRVRPATAGCSTMRDRSAASAAMEVSFDGIVAGRVGRLVGCGSRQGVQVLASEGDYVVAGGASFSQGAVASATRRICLQAESTGSRTAVSWLASCLHPPYQLRGTASQRSSRSGSQND